MCKKLNELAFLILLSSQIKKKYILQVLEAKTWFLLNLKIYYNVWWKKYKYRQGVIIQ